MNENELLEQTKHIFKLYKIACEDCVHVDIELFIISCLNKNIEKIKYIYNIEKDEDVIKYL